MSRKALRWGLAGVCTAVLGLGGCNSLDDSCVTKTGNPSGHCGIIPDVVADLAEQCGIDVRCQGGGLEEGNASISGVASVDTFFRTVLDVEQRASALDRELGRALQAIRVSFGIAADADLASALEARLSQDLEGGLTLVAGAPRCEVDARAVLDATARCEGEAAADSSVECRGACEVSADADVDCGADGELSCTFVTADAACDGTCTGTCALEPPSPGVCEGTCHGSCDGTCELVSGVDGSCAGRCDGLCDGRCELETSGDCQGTCTGECTQLAPADGCQGALRASCLATGDGAVACEGRCDGDAAPPSASVECQASAEAQTKVRVECTPPRVTLDYRLRADLDPTAAAELDAALRSLERRLPELLTLRSRAELVVDAAGGLGGAATGAVQGAIDGLDAGGNLAVQFGLICAAGQLGNVAEVLERSGSGLSDKLAEAVDVSAALGAP